MYMPLITMKHHMFSVILFMFASFMSLNSLTIFFVTMATIIFVMFVIALGVSFFSVITSSFMSCLL